MTATSLVLDASVTVSAGDVVMLDDYATQPAAVQDLFAFLADGTTGLYSNGDAADLFAA